MNQDIAVRGPGGLADPGGQGSEDIVTYAKWVVESGLFGRGITQAQAGLKMLVGRELGIQPLAAVRNIYIFEAQGRPVVILDATLMGAMVRTSGRYDYEVEQHDDEATVLAMYRLNQLGHAMGAPQTRTLLGRESFSQQDAIKRGLAGKDGPWKQGYAKEMRFARCLSRLVDHYAPELLLGLSVPVVTQDDADEMPMGHNQRKAIFAGLKPYEMTDSERHDWASDVLGRRVDSFAEGQPSCPTRREASMLLTWLDEQPEVVTVVAPDEGTATAGECPEDSNEEGGMPADIGPVWTEDPERGTDVPMGAGGPKLGEVEAPAPAAPQVTNLVAEQSTLDVLMTELEAVRGRRSAKVVDGWLRSWLDNEKLIGIEHADEEQAERGLSWLRAQFSNRTTR
jgi:hypothetical protein